MGFDRLINFISKNLNNDSIEDIYLNLNLNKIIANHIMIDISFIIYQSLIELEEEINNIIKIILGIPFLLIEKGTLNKKLYDYFSLEHWKNNFYNIEKIIDGFNEDEIIVNFINYINKIKIDNNTIIENILIDKIFYILKKYITCIHNNDLLESINIIFDGIPSLSKILEQRRRRIKNFLESQEKKLRFDNYFKDIQNSYQKFNDITFDYFKWLKYRYTIDKSFGPSSPIIKSLEIKLYNKFKNVYQKVKININSGNINGEADYKLFKQIYNENLTGEIVIHTIDSDLVHQIIVQQNYFNLIKKDINLSVIRYNQKNNNYVQLIEANIIIKNMLYVYNTKINNVIYDFSLLFYFFGNDNLPSSYEIGPELNFDYYCNVHKNVFNNDTIIKMIKGKIYFSFENFNLYLKEINKNVELNKTKIILSRYFKINNYLIYFLTEKLKLNFKEILLLCKKILFDDGKKYNNLDEDDLRYKLIKKYNTLEYPKEINDNDLNVIFEKLLNILDVSDTEDNFCGLPVYKKVLHLNDDNYQILYNNLTDMIVEDLSNDNYIIYDNIPIQNILNNNQITICNNKVIYDYLKKLYHCVITLFDDMSNYNSNSITFFKYYEVPPINLICNYLDTHTDLINQFENEINKEYLNDNQYFNSINHHILISPFIKKKLWKFNSNDLNFIVEHLKDLNNFWFDDTPNFLYKDFNINEFFIRWNQCLIQLSFLPKITIPEILNEAEELIYNDFDLLV